MSSRDVGNYEKQILIQFLIIGIMGYLLGHKHGHSVQVDGQEMRYCGYPQFI